VCITYNFRFREAVKLRNPMSGALKMPIYEYRCQSCGHDLEKLQRLSDAALTDCPECGKSALKRLVSAAGFRLKGAGWYETDFKTSNQRNLVDSGSDKTANTESTATSSASESKSSDNKSSDSKGSESKSNAQKSSDGNAAKTEKPAKTSSTPAASS
jgi:putative FmdB family regulatory protein